MPQYPIVPLAGGNQSKLNLSAQTVVKSTPGTIVRVTVLAVATGGKFGVYDASTVGGIANGARIVEYSASWPAVGTVINLEFPCANGIVVDPGTAGVVSVSFS